MAGFEIDVPEMDVIVFFLLFVPKIFIENYFLLVCSGYDTAEFRNTPEAKKLRIKKRT